MCIAILSVQILTVASVDFTGARGLLRCSADVFCMSLCMFTTMLDCVLKGCKVCRFRGDAFALRAHRPLRKFLEDLSREGISSLKLRSLVVISRVRDHLG